MSGLLKGLFSDGTSSSRQAQSTAVHTLEVRNSPADPAQLAFIHAAGAPENSEPLWSVLNNKAGNPDILIYKGSSNPHNVFGNGSFGSMSGSATLSMRDIPLKVRSSSLGEGYSVETQQLGKLKWKTNPLTGTGLQLHDSSGTVIAKVKSSSLGMGNKSILVYVQADEFLMDLIVFTAMAIRTMKNTENETVSEIIQAVAGS